jgi:glycosyltransferase involved in cell wall biosynthesis
MKILVTAGFETLKASSLKGGVLVNTGGWVDELIKYLREHGGLEVGLAVKSNDSVYRKIISDDIPYYFVPSRRFNKLLPVVKDVENVINDFKPDIIWAEGAEVPFAAFFFKLFEGIKLVSIKGVLSDINNYTLGAISLNKSILSLDLLDFILVAELLIRKNILSVSRLKYEKIIYNYANIFVGRTVYDRSATLSNHNARYFFLNENIRESFYKEEWNYNNVDKYSIFVSNGIIARKGFHLVLEALKLIEREFPRIKLYVIGSESVNFRDEISYGGYISRKIKKISPKFEIVWLGSLTSGEMAKQLVKTHVNIIPSLVENSSNSLGEALVVGVPTVISYSGGVSSLATDNIDALFYRATNIEMMAMQIKRLFTSSDLCRELSENAIVNSRELYNKNKFMKDLTIILNSLKNEISV